MHGSRAVDIVRDQGDGQSEQGREVRCCSRYERAERGQEEGDQNERRKEIRAKGSQLSPPLFFPPLEADDAAAKMVMKTRAVDSAMIAPGVETESPIVRKKAMRAMSMTLQVEIAVRC